MKKLAFLGGALGLGMGALMIAHPLHAADHLDAPGVMSNPMADITDVYAWMDPSASKVNLIMDVSPGDLPAQNRAFGPSVLYVFHVTASASFGGASNPEVDVICKFATNTSAQCWVGTADYVTGDPSNTAGIASASGKVRLFAGRRSDPFFFNLQGFRDAVALTDMAIPGLVAANAFDAAGCPQLSATTAGQVRNCLFEAPGATNCNGNTTFTAAPPCATDSADCFAHLDVRAIVLQVDKGLLGADAAHPIISVWASTHTAS